MHVKLFCVSVGVETKEECNTNKPKIKYTTYLNTFADHTQHSKFWWSKYQMSAIYNNGIVNGFILNNILLFSNWKSRIMNWDCPS